MNAIKEMTGDELASAIMAELGFLVIGQFRRRSIGEIIPPRSCGWQDAPIETPLRVIRQSSRAEWASQKPTIVRLLGLPLSPARGNMPHFYRVEAAD